ncbi:MAG TPA: asparaginase, partial [Candidatus Thermoplasmatota archaeon]|nr:asparaginase [Candidatus Thermoplasmatota archaeon]
VVDGRGSLVRAAGDPDLATFLRSSAKPFQALPLVTTGAADRFGLTEAELALACASHMGERAHVRTAAAMLAKAGLDEAALGCGAHPPRSREAAQTPLCHNCSGKHAGLLLLQTHLGGDAADYLDPASPAQAAVRAAVEEVAGVSGLPWGVDGCGAPIAAMPLRVAARTFARLALPQGVRKETADALERVRRAMTRHPDMVGGSGSFDTDLMDASEDRLVSKVGAEGVQGVGDLGGGLGLFLKVEDGEKRAVPPATVEALRQLAWLEGRAFEVLGDWWRPSVRNWSGRAVGEMRPVLTLREA